jgi:hypothetical protein
MPHVKIIIFLYFIKKKKKPKSQKKEKRKDGKAHPRNGGRPPQQWELVRSPPKEGVANAAAPD